MSWSDYLGAAVLLMAVSSAISTVWQWWTGRHPDRDERIRVKSLALAIDSHGPSTLPEEVGCYTARAATFEEYIRSGQRKTERRGARS